MPYLRKSRVKPEADWIKYIRRAHLGLFGDLVCWNCNANLVTPIGSDVKPGWGRCPLCHARFRTTRRIAEQANRLTAHFDTRALANPNPPETQALRRHRFEM